MITVYALLSIKDNATYVGMALDAAGKNGYINILMTEESRVPCLLDAVGQEVPYVVLKSLSAMRGFFYRCNLRLWLMQTS